MQKESRIQEEKALQTALLPDQIAWFGQDAEHARSIRKVAYTIFYNVLESMSSENMLSQMVSFTTFFANVHKMPEASHTGRSGIRFSAENFHLIGIDFISAVGRILNFSV